MGIWNMPYTNMKKRKSNIQSFINANFFWIGLFILIVFVVPILIISDNRQDKYYEENLTTNPTPTVSSNSLYIEVTPTTVASQRPGWKKFIHPNNDFNFEYPQEWTIVLTQRTHDPSWYTVRLKSNISNAGFYFMTGGRGSPYYDYEENSTKIINGRTTNWSLMYRNNIAFEAVASFPNNDFNNKMIGLYISLPQENQDEFIQIIEDIIATLELPQ